jgi:hypothetical protein
VNRPSDVLIDKLRERQTLAGLTEKAFASTIGINDSTWVLIRQRTTKPGLKFIAGVTRRYPDLMPDVMTFLQEEPGLMEMYSQAVPV